MLWAQLHSKVKFLLSQPNSSSNELLGKVAKSCTVGCLMILLWFVFRVLAAMLLTISSGQDRRQKAWVTTAVSQVTRVGMLVLPCQ